MKYLIEDRRSELLNISKHADNYVDQSKGKNRYARRVLSKVSRSTTQYNSIDMNMFFKSDILLINVPVQGETDNYIVSIKFDGVLEELQQILNKNNEILDLKSILKALQIAFNSKNVYIHCTCPDWNYRMSYWSRINDISSDPSIEQTNNGRRIVNPDDTKGRGCKHALLVLSNNKWLNPVSRTIYNYIIHMENNYPKMYADIIYPAIYGKEYEDDVQLSFDDSDELISDEETIDISNRIGRNRGRFTSNR